jgi:hypothetical protein
MRLYSLNNESKGLAALAGFAATLMAIFCCSAVAKRIAGPNTATQYMLNAFHQALSDFKKDCGRYPLTTEGLQALLVAPGNLPCKEKSHWDHNPRWLEKPMTDPWKQDIQYTSDGSSYRIQASHGYSVTNESPSQGGFHYEHIGPTPIDPRPPKNPGMAD